MQKKTYLLSELADLLGCKLHGDPNEKIVGVNTLEKATKGDISFLANLTYKETLKSSFCCAVIVQQIEPDFPKKNFLISSNPSESFQQLFTLFHLNKANTGFSGIHPTAVIHETAILGKDLQIGPYVIIDQHVHIEDNTVLAGHVVIGPYTRIGKNCHLYSHVTVRENCVLKNRVILQPGVVIGSCGFGYIPDEKNHFHKLEQLGNVILEDDVEIGANTTIDRARFTTTIIKKGVKIDNLVQIAHNVEIDQHTIIAAQTGIAGSTKIGAHVMMGGQVGIVGHISIENGTKLATRSGVNRSLKKGTYRGSPAYPIEEYNRQLVHIKRLAKYAKRIEALEESIK